MRGSSTDS